MRNRAIFAGALLALCIADDRAAAQGAAPLPKSIAIHVGYGPGGGYDTNARLVARHWGRHLPGEPAIIVQNMPGAGGLRVLNWISTAAPADGSAVAITGSPNFLSPLFDAKGAQFDPMKMKFLGSLAGESAACAIWHTAGAKTLVDLTRVDVLAGASGPASVSTVYPLALNAVLGARFKLVQGYTGSAQAILAMEKGEIQAFCGWTHNAQPEWVKDGRVHLVTQIGLTPDPMFPGVPLALDHARTQEDRQVLELIFAPQSITRPYLVPPLTPDAILQTMRKGLTAMASDDNYRREAARMNMDPGYLGGEEISTIISRIYAAPVHVVERAKKIVNP
jgi:tripartite-type tricarboxylate transporter receptor subunit TctC